MRLREMTIAAVVLGSVALTPALALAYGTGIPGNPIIHNHPVLAKILEYRLYKRNHGGGAPAPLLAAGIPAFVALGGGAAATKLVRRFRGSTV